MGAIANKQKEPEFRNEVPGRTDNGSVSGHNIGAGQVPGKFKSSSSADAGSVSGRKSSSSADAGSVPGRKSPSSAEVNEDAGSVPGMKSSCSAGANKDAGSVPERKSPGSEEVNKDACAVPGRKPPSSAEVNKDANSAPGRKSSKPSTSVTEGPHEMLASYFASSDEMLDWFCQPCDLEGQHVEAAGFCNDCVEYLCKTCYSSHRKHKPSRNHQLLDKNQMPKSKTPSSIFQCLTWSRQDHENTSKPNQLIHEVSQSLSGHRRDPAKLRASLADSINVKADNDQKDCSITGCAVLTTGHLVVIDRNNKSVKLIDVTQGKIMSVVSLSSEPWDITEAGNGQIAVTLPDTDTIQLMAVVSGTFYPCRKIKMKGVCNILYNKGRLLVLFCAPGRVEVIDMQGVVLMTIERDINGERLFGDYLCYLAISPDGGTLYISDWRKDTVISVTTEGRVAAKYMVRKLRNPQGLTVAPDGTVYVCGQVFNNVHQVTADLTKIQFILRKEDGVYFPQSICYSDTKDCKLYIGSSPFSKHCNHIQVFHLQ